MPNRHDSIVETRWCFQPKSASLDKINKEMRNECFAQKKNQDDFIEPEVQRRVLNALNSAIRAEDLVRLEQAGIGKKLAKQILDKRDKTGAFGFTDLKQVIDIEGITKEIFDNLIRLFSRIFFGEWKRPYATKLPDEDETDYDIAHAAMLHTGCVLFLPESNTKTTLLWDPTDEVNPQFEFLVNQPDEKLFCSGHAFLSDGKLLVVGGGGTGPDNVNRAWKFDPIAKTWEKTMGDMSYDRVEAG